MAVDMEMAAQSSDIELATLLRLVWDRKWLIISVVSIFAIGSLAYGFVATEWYRSESTLVPAESQSGGPPLSGSLSALGSLAGLSGFGLDDSRTAEAIAILQSRDFANSFIQRNNLLPVLLAEHWDAAEGDWKISDPESRPDIRDAIEIFDRDIRTVSQNSENGLVTLAVTWTDPQQAASWVSLMVDQLNEQMRARALAEAEENITFLEDQLADTSLATLRLSLANILEAELEKLMLAKGRSDFVFRVIDSPQIARKPDRPRRLLILLVGTILGGVLAFAWVLLRFSFDMQSGSLGPSARAHGHAD